METPELDRFVVRPNGPLKGTVCAGGAKNSALKLMAACLLCEGRHVLSGVPEITDVSIMAEMLSAIGVKVERIAGSGDLVIDTPWELVPEAPYDLVEKMRASIVVLGPLLARAGRARVSMPGGDDFGARPIDFHLNSFRRMGAEFTTSHGYVEGLVPAGRLAGDLIVLEYPSHTATDNVLMASVLAKGTTVIENAAREPEVADLAVFLRAMGARITGAGTSRIVVEGVEELEPANHHVISDRVVAATFLSAAAIAGGEIVVEDARVDHMTMLVGKFRQMGVEITQRPEGLCASSDGRLTSVDIATLPYPGVATDYKPFLVTMMTVADGVGIVTENLFAGRFRYIDELRRMGADIRTEGHHAVVRGVQRLSGAQVRATDLRAGAALVLAGLVADGETIVSDARDAGCPTDAAGAGRPTDAPGMLEAARNGDRLSLARLITRLERGGPAGREVASLAYRDGSEAPTLGITGAPGAGKSTLVSRLIAVARTEVGALGVIAIDPTSPFTGGAILGDRVRMQDHALDPGVFIRSMATRGHLGGLSIAVPEGVRLLSAAGMERVFIETVGVGQVEVEVASAADTTVVVLTPGWGDAVQANKAGLLEVADIFVINKSDRPGARQTRQDLAQHVTTHRLEAADHRHGRVVGRRRRRSLGCCARARGVARYDRRARHPPRCAARARVPQGPPRPARARGGSAHRRPP
jgi:UDP-N-acetylglucosamine 1-carboxyvinyltransferase